MAFDRRSFLASLGISAGALATGIPVAAQSPGTFVKKGGSMVLRSTPYTLSLKHVFTVASSSRTTTPVMLTEIEYDGVVGYGEASMPPYLGESHETVAAFLAKVDMKKYKDPFQLETILADIDAITPGNAAAKASIDIALHDLIGKLLGKPWHVIWGLDPSATPFTTFTIGIDTPEVVRQKTREAAEFKVLKVKLGRSNDKEMVESIRSVTDVPLTSDVNQGWKNKEQALDMIHWLKEKGVILIEQPMPKEMLDEHAWLTERSPLPIIADEAFQRLSDLKRIYGAYSGINIKLMKSTGMREAKKMKDTARALGMKVMLGCMIESSCAISAAAQLSPGVDWADLDGALLISNDRFEGVHIKEGKVILNDKPGIGVVKI